MKLYQKRIAIAVFSIHGLVILGLLSHHFASRRIKAPRPMIVHTVHPPAPLAVEQKKSPVSISSPRTAAKPAPKLLSTKPKTVPKPIAKNKTEPLKEKSLEPLLKKDRPALTLPSKIPLPKTQIDSPPQSNSHFTYGETLIAFLQEVLDLPEYGEVRAEMEIDPFGSLVDFQVLETKSIKNAEFLKNQLPNLNFPSFKDFGIIETKQKFIIIFRNK